MYHHNIQTVRMTCVSCDFPNAPCEYNTSFYNLEWANIGYIKWATIYNFLNSNFGVFATMVTCTSSNGPHQK